MNGFDVQDNKTEKLDVHPIQKQSFTKTAVIQILS